MSAAFAVHIISAAMQAQQIWQAMLAPETGLIGRAFADNKATLHVHGLHAYGKGKHQQIDDTPFGGGAGMLLQIEPLHQAISAARAISNAPVVLLSPRGRRFDQAMARALSQEPGITLVCGRFEGVDERVYRYVDTAVSIGDFVLSAGEPAAYVMIDAILRLRLGVLGNPQSLTHESFAEHALEYPQYTKPAVYDGASVPDVLLSGNHQKIAAWREQQAQLLTHQLRPDLLEHAVASIAHKPDV